MIYQVMAKGGSWTSKPTESFEHAKADAEAYHRATGRHCIVMRSESVYSTETLEEILKNNPMR